MASYIVQNDDYWIAKNDNGYGNALILNASWSSRYLAVVEKYKVKIITLNGFLGWPDSDISFLLEVPGIHGVNILSDKVTDVSPIFQLEQLKTLSLHCKAKMAGDFTKLGHLEDLGLGWRNVYSSVFDLTALKRLCILGYPETDLRVWPRNAMLKRLSLHSRRLECLSGLKQFPNIRKLDLCYCPKLESLDAVKSSKTIQELRLHCCPRILNLRPISHLTDLRVLEIEGCQDIQSLAPVTRCKKLKRLQIAGNTTVLDGNLSGLKRLPKLRKVLLAHRKHYSHTDGELEKK